MEIKRGEVWIADLGAPNGCEQRGVRPVIILQNDVGNHFSPTVIVAALTDNRKKFMPTHVAVSKAEGIEKDSVALMEQIRTIDKTLLKHKVCSVSADTMVKVNHAIRVSLGLIPVKGEGTC